MVSCWREIFCFPHADRQTHEQQVRVWPLNFQVDWLRLCPSHSLSVFPSSQVWFGLEWLYSLEGIRVQGLQEGQQGFVVWLIVLAGGACVCVLCLYPCMCFSCSMRCPGRTAVCSHSYQTHREPFHWPGWSWKRPHRYTHTHTHHSCTRMLDYYDSSFRNTLLIYFFVF